MEKRKTIYSETHTRDGFVSEGKSVINTQNFRRKYRYASKNEPEKAYVCVKGGKIYLLTQRYAESEDGRPNDVFEINEMAEYEEKGEIDSRLLGYLCSVIYMDEPVKSVTLNDSTLKTMKLFGSKILREKDEYYDMILPVGSGKQDYTNPIGEINEKEFKTAESLILIKGDSKEAVKEAFRYAKGEKTEIEFSFEEIKNLTEKEGSSYLCNEILLERYLKNKHTNLEEMNFLKKYAQKEAWEEYFKLLRHRKYDTLVYLHEILESSPEESRGIETIKPKEMKTEEYFECLFLSEWFEEMRGIKEEFIKKVNGDMLYRQKINRFLRNNQEYRTVFKNLEDKDLHDLFTNEKIEISSNNRFCADAIFNCLKVSGEIEEDSETIRQLTKMYIRIRKNGCREDIEYFDKHGKSAVVKAVQKKVMKYDKGKEEEKEPMDIIGEYVKTTKDSIMLKIKNILRNP